MYQNKKWRPLAVVFFDVRNLDEVLWNFDQNNSLLVCKKKEKRMSMFLSLVLPPICSG